MTAIKLFMRPDVSPISWKEFKTYPSYSIGIDGYVYGGPKFDKKDKHANFNHHEEVSRLETRATCAQVLMAIRQGFFECFNDDNGIRADVYANDCDQDVCVSWFLLNNSCIVQGTMNPLINRLVYMEDMLDCTAGAYPFPATLKTLEHFAWIFHPYNIFRSSGQLSKRDPDAFRNVVLEVEHRIMDHIMGNSSTLPLDTRYEKIDSGNGWSMVKEIGPQARTAMFSDGIKFFISVRERGNGIYDYVIGKMSDFIGKDLIKLIKKLNEIEMLQNDFWGGGNTIIGSPRINGSKITPKEMAEIIERF